jgi:hypothetical protein
MPSIDVYFDFSYAVRVPAKVALRCMASLFCSVSSPDSHPSGLFSLFIEKAIAGPFPLAAMPGVIGDGQ